MCVSLCVCVVVVVVGGEVVVVVVEVVVDVVVVVVGRLHWDRVIVALSSHGLDCSLIFRSLTGCTTEASWPCLHLKQNQRKSVTYGQHSPRA